MPWNEPGGNGKDPWGHRKNEQGPPDLDEFVKKVRDKLTNLMGGDGGGDDDGKGASNALIGFFFMIALVIWGMFGFYIIQPAELGVEMRLGSYTETTGSGLHWHWPYPIETVEKLNVEQVRAITHKALMLTQDENIVEIELVVQYRLKDAGHYLFNVYDPDETLRQATESALREVVGTSRMDDVLTSERTRVATDTKILVQDILDRYGTGLIVTSVNMQDAQPPSAVQESFADVIKAREDEERHKNKAEAYSNEIVQKAGGIADKLRQEAHAYKAQVVARAEGETQRFLNVLQQYEKAPEITRQRLYLESIESVLTNTRKIMIDVERGNNLMLLQLDKLLGSASEYAEKSHHSSEPSSLTVPLPTPTEGQDISNRTPDIRDRGSR